MHALKSSEIRLAILEQAAWFSVRLLPYQTSWFGAGAKAPLPRSTPSTPTPAGLSPGCRRPPGGSPLQCDPGCRWQTAGMRLAASRHESPTETRRTHTHMAKQQHQHQHPPHDILQRHPHAPHGVPAKPAALCQLNLHCTAPRQNKQCWSSELAALAGQGGCWCSHMPMHTHA